MKRLRILVAALIAAASCMAAVPASSSAASSTLTITCTQSPAACTAVGQIGSLYGVAVFTTHGWEAEICLDAICSRGALLKIAPGLFYAAAAVPALGGTVVLTAHTLLVDVEAAGTYALTLTGGGGIIGLVTFARGHGACLILDHLRLATIPC
jgi:hypothetical protein